MSNQDRRHLTFRRNEAMASAVESDRSRADAARHIALRRAREAAPSSELCFRVHNYRGGMALFRFVFLADSDARLMRNAGDDPAAWAFEQSYAERVLVRDVLDHLDGVPRHRKLCLTVVAMAPTWTMRSSIMLALLRKRRSPCSRQRREPRLEMLSSSLRTRRRQTTRAGRSCNGWRRRSFRNRERQRPTI